MKWVLGILGALGRDHIAGALCSANVPRPAASSLSSLQGPPTALGLEARGCG